MKTILLLFSMSLFISIGFFIMPKVHKIQGKSQLPAENYFLTPQYGHEGEGITEYRNAMKKELKKMKATRAIGGLWQNEGPFNTGGRINCVAMHPNQSNTYLVGCADGGIFKTIDGGNSWTPVFDQSIALSVSSIEYDKSNPLIVYAGTGDQVVGGYSHMGNGIYKSIDGGNSWNHLGLDNVGTIAKIVIAPNNPSVLYVGTTGNIFLSDNNRGVYKSIDGGLTWNNVLFLSQNAGIGDLVINPNNSMQLFATGRHRLRSNAQSIITGPEAKIYRTNDGGITWDTLSSGLPTGDQCRIGLAMSQSNPFLIYALYVDANNLDFGGLYKTTNGGGNWTLVNTTTPISMGGFGWYFGEIRIDPNNNQVVYILSVNLYKSINGGVNFTQEFSTHADKHDLKFKNSNELLLATDGGFYTSTNAGSTWVQNNNIPITQFYETAYNPFDGTNYYGGAQDNGTNYGSLNLGLNNWIHYYGGDGFRPQFSAIDDQTFYTEWQNGNIVATDDGGATWSTINSTLDVSRTSWNTPYFLSTFNDNTLYAGTYQVYKNTNAPFDNWFPISPDLTDGTQNTFHVITSINQSPLSSNMLYAGTSDANVWYSPNDGGTWQSINTGLPNRNVSCVLPSPNYSNAVFTSMSGYRNNDSLPHLYYSTNNGTNWNSFSGNLPNLAINDIWVLPVHEDSCVIVATDGGVYATETKGQSWERVGSNMPLIPVFDLEYNPTTKRIIAGTFARSMQTIPIDSIFKPKTNTNTSVGNITANSSIRIYPNPSNDILHIESSNYPIEKVILFDFQGRKIKEKFLNQVSTCAFSLENIKTGTYVIDIITKSGHVSKTIIKN